MQYCHGAVGKALSNEVLHLFVTFWFLWCLIPIRCWHSHTHREMTQKAASGAGTHGRCLSIWGRGEVGSVGEEGTRWHLLAEAKQELHKSVQSSHFQPVNISQTHHSSLSFPSFVLFYFRLLLKVLLLLLLLLRCPESRLPSDHSGTSLALPRQPLARPNPGFSCLGLKIVRFFSSKMFSKESVDYSYSALKMHFKK